MPVLAAVHAKAPVSCSATAASSTSMTIACTAPDGAGYTVELQRKLTTDPVSSFTTIGTYSPPSWPDTGLSASTSYDYRLRAINPLTGKKGPWTDTFSGTTSAPSGDPSVILSASQLTAARAKQAGNTTQFQALKSACDTELPKVTMTIYNGADSMSRMVDFALLYQIYKNVDATVAAQYADKSVALLKSALRDNQREWMGALHYLARGDGVTTVYNLPYTDNINAGTFKVYTATVGVQAMTKGTAGGQDSMGQAVLYRRLLKVSNTSDGPADFTERVITARGLSGYTWSAGDWRQNPEYKDEMIDWSGAASEPTTASTYYLTYVDESLASQMTSGFTLDTGAGTVTFTAAPAANKVIFVVYQYGTHAADYSTLAYQQTSESRAGINTMMYSGYPDRFVMKFAAIAFDWLYDYGGFSRALKDEAVYVFQRWYAIIKGGGGSEVFRPNCPPANYGGAHYGARALVAAALYARGEQNGTTLKDEMLTYRTNNVITLCTAAPASGYATDKGGLSLDGWSYGTGAVINVLCGSYGLESVGAVTATEERIWASEVVQAVLHGQMTNTDMVATDGTHRYGTIYDIGVSYQYPLPMSTKDLMYWAAFLADDATIQKYGNAFIANPAGQQTVDHQDLLLRDPNATTLDWTASLTKTYRAIGAEWICGRAAWDYASLYVAFICGNLTQDSEHFGFTKPGHLRIQRGADDLIMDTVCFTGLQNDTGNATLTPPSNDSTCSNIILCDDGGAGVQTYRYNQTFAFGVPGNFIKSYESITAYQYYVGDYRASYSNYFTPGSGGPCSALQRCVFVVWPDVVVVYDRVELFSSSYFAQLQWFAKVNPSVSGDAWNITVGSSKLYATTVSGLTLTTANSGSMTVNSVSGVYRVSSVPASPTASIRYCIAFQVGAAAASAYAVARIVSGTDFEGVIVNGVTVVLFGQTAGPVSTAGGKSYSYTGTNGATITHYVCDLTPNQTYTLSGDANGTATASAAGVLTFTTTGNGSPQTVTIT